MDINWTVISNRAAVSAAVSEAKKRALEIIGGKAESYAKQLCPVKTGRLRGSITHEQADDSTELVGSNVHYAPYVELGTYKMNGKAYLRPAVEGHTAEYQAVVAAELKKI